MSCRSQRTIKHTEKAVAQHHMVTSWSRPPKSKPNGKKRLASPAEDDSGTVQASLGNTTSTSKRKLNDWEWKRAHRHSPPASDVEEIVLATDDDNVEEAVAVGSIDSEKSAESGTDDELKEQHCAPLPEVLEKKKKAKDLLTIFSEKRSVKFSFPASGKVKVLKGHWCNECK
ncbi:hypothetical protein AX14_005119 [Amanita brunnescens Koide BX004]|nr:hypothetical protein AX14_005119 [Amanita brunnescens Koide BX004]